MTAPIIAREVLRARLRPGWRLAIALPIAVSLAAGLAETGHAAHGALRLAAASATPAIVQLELVIDAWVDDRRAPVAIAGCAHGSVMTAVVLGAGIAIVSILLGLRLAGAGRRRPGDGDEGAGGDGGDEDEQDLPFDDVERLVVIAVPRQEAPGAPGSSTETN